MHRLTDTAPAVRDPRITVVILTYNRADEVLRTLTRLSSLEERPALIVVDNGSSDGTPNRIARAYPLVKVVSLARNIGAAARNVGVEHAQTPYVALSDDDTWWESGSLTRAADVLDRLPDIAVVTARVLVGPENREDPTSGRMRESPLARPAGWPGPRILGFLAGASMVRREAFLDVGGFDPQLFLGGEEELVAYDLAEHGWGMLYLAEAVVHHHPSSVRDSRARRRLLFRNRLWVTWLRRPLTIVWRDTWRALRRLSFTPELWPAFIEALAGAKRIVKRRRRLSSKVETQIQCLEHHVPESFTDGGHPVSIKTKCLSVISPPQGPTLHRPR
jgi:GT2 family glycosyltransferase